MENFQNINKNVSINDYPCQIHLCILLKTWFLLFHLFSYYSSDLTVARDFSSLNRNATGISKCNEHRKYWALINSLWI